MKLPEKNSKKIAKSVAIVLPILLLASGGLIWRAKHSSKTSSTQGSGDLSSLNETGHGMPISPTQQEQDAAHVVTGSKSGGVPVASIDGGAKDRSLKASGSSTNGSASVSADRGSSGNATQANVGQSTAPSIAQSAAPSVTKDGCFTITFKHKALASHSSDDECSHHRNLIKLDRLDANPSSVCIRVNGTPVRHESISGKTDEFVIGAVAGPKDVVTARFCVGKAKCGESCPYPKKEAVKKDEFLEAISGGSDDDANPAMAQWEAGDAEKNQEVNNALDHEIKKELEEQENPALRTAANNSKLRIFKDWLNEGETAACGSHHASRATASVQ